MPSLEHLKKRRAEFMADLDRPALLMAGGWRPRNYPQNPYSYRADSNVLFFFADPEPDSAVLFDPADGCITLYLHQRTPEDALWHGTVPSFEEMRARHGVDRVEPLEKLQDSLSETTKGRELDSIAVADEAATRLARRLTGQDLDFADASRLGRPELLTAIGRLRLRKQAPELAEMRRTAEVTRQAHIAAMQHTRPGVHEQTLTGLVDGCFWRHGCVPAYSTILSVRGEVLHNHAHDQVLQAGDILLLDAGAENATGYCSDVTRSWPVGGKLEAEEAVIYDTVLRAEVALIEAVKPGMRYRDLHLLASRIVADGLIEVGLLRGHADALVESGAHALFFPHGVGHLIGLDVHDMEAYGDLMAYAEGRQRSAQFGLAYLRLDLDLQPGMTFTSEPGIYFVPAILHDPKFREQFADQVDFERAETFLRSHEGRGFGGIRIEDDVLCTESGFEVLTAAIPKERAAIEELVGTASA